MAHKIVSGQKALGIKSMFDFIFGVIAFVVGISMLIAICTFVADIVRYPFLKRREKAEKRRDELYFQEQERQRQLAIKQQAEEEAAAKKEAALKQRRINKKLKSNGYLSEGRWEVGDLCEFLREYGIKERCFL